MKTIVSSFNGLNHQSFYDSLNHLEQQALILDSNEVFTVGSAVSVAIYSCNYWTANAQSWFNRLKASQVQVAKQSSIPMLASSCKIGYGSLGASDVGGAIDGVALGPGGALAGGVLGAATASLGNLSGQVMSCLFNWW